MNQVLLLFKRDIHSLEFDPETQYRFHKMWAWFWFLLMAVVPIFPRLRHDIAALLILEASLWANFATHFGAMSAALAAKSSAAKPTNKQLAEQIEQIPHIPSSAELLE